MTDKLRALCETVLKLDGEATKGPWTAEKAPIDVDYCSEHWVEGPKDIEDFTDEGGVFFKKFSDCEAVAHYRTSAPQLARALLKAVKVVDAAKDVVQFVNPMFCDTDECLLKMREALAEFEAP